MRVEIWERRHSQSLNVRTRVRPSLNRNGSGSAELLKLGRVSAMGHAWVDAVDASSARTCCREANANASWTAVVMMDFMAAKRYWDHVRDQRLINLLVRRMIEAYAQPCMSVPGDLSTPCNTQKSRH